MDPMRVLVGCETSGVVRRAFAAAMADQWGGHAEEATMRAAE